MGVEAAPLFDLLQLGHPQGLRFAVAFLLHSFPTDAFRSVGKECICHEAKSASAAYAGLLRRGGLVEHPSNDFVFPKI